MKRAAVLLAALVSLFCAAAAHATTYTVTDTTDSGAAGTLRWAILQVNGDVGPDRIVFNMAGEGVHTIHPTSSIPVLTTTVAIDGTTQPKYNGAPLIQIDGTNADELVLASTAPHSSIRGLVFNRFGNINVDIAADACSLSACYVGVNAAGTQAMPNPAIIGVYVHGGKNEMIGGHRLGDGNIISGNGEGISFSSSSADTLAGNYIGTDVTGEQAVPNTIDGVDVGSSPSMVVGGPGIHDGNVISASGQYGMWITSGAPVPSGQGISLYRNYIGTDASGQNAIPNAREGILLWTAYSNIGDIGMGNVISGNHGSGVECDGTRGSQYNAFTGNRIGVSADGTKSLGNDFEGIELLDSGNNFIGGSTVDGSGNLIGGNQDGIGIDTQDPTNDLSTNNIIQGNAIGTSFNGALDLGNRERGIGVDGDFTIVGGITNNTGNVIGHNQYGGVTVFSLQNTIRGNSIFDNNLGLGIDLSTGGGNPVTLNDTLDVDSGPNYLQNFPVITAVSRVGAQVRLQGRYSSEPNSDFDLDFYSNSQCNTYGYGEGESWLGTVGITTDASGVALFDVSYNLTNIVGYIFTCTATDFIGDTSEFSPCAPLATQTAAGPGPPVFGFEPPLPSPARRSTSLTFTLAEPAQVSLRAYDVSGRVVAELFEGTLGSGPHTVPWSVQSVRSGVYFCRLRAQGAKSVEAATRSIIVVR